MRLILAANDGLNAVSCDRLLGRLFEDRTTRAPEVTIDLHQAAFIDPYGAGCLVMVARHLASRNQKLICVLPSNGNVQELSERIGLVQALRPLAELRNLASSGRLDGREGTLPLTSISNRADVQTVLSYLVRLSQGSLDFDTGDVLDATKVVSGLCHNVIDHSAGEGLATAHIYSDRQGRRFVSLAVVDAGVGIRASLARRHQEAGTWRHGEAIRRALGGLSSRQQGGGLGLRSIHGVVRRYGGRLSIRSGDERLYVAAERQPRMLRGALFPGTLVSISFSRRH